MRGLVDNSWRLEIPTIFMKRRDSSNRCGDAKAGDSSTVDIYLYTHAGDVFLKEFGVFGPLHLWTPYTVLIWYCLVHQFWRLIVESVTDYDRWIVGVYTCALRSVV